VHFSWFLEWVLLTVEDFPRFQSLFLAGPIVRFEAVNDSSKLLQWIRWESSEVTYRPVDATHTAVTWRISFDRQLDPIGTSGHGNGLPSRGDISLSRGFSSGNLA
jgi:hypothetical protein